MKNIFRSSGNIPGSTIATEPEITEIPNDVENANFKDEKPNQEDQMGVQKAEAVTILWTKKQLIVAYAL